MFFKSYFKVFKYLFGLIVLCNIECLKFIFFFSLIWIVLEFDKVFGKDVIVEFIFDGILIIFFFKFFWLLRGFFTICINGIFGFINFFLSLVMLSLGGFFGNFILLKIE